MDKSSELDCYLYYMWNAWSLAECTEVFGDNCSIFWNRWLRYVNVYKDQGAPSAFYADMAKTNRKKLVNRAKQYYAS